MDQKNFNKLADGMEEVNRNMAIEIENTAPFCHMKKMNLEQSDSIDGYYIEWWECEICGHKKDL